MDSTFSSLSLSFVKYLNSKLNVCLIVCAATIIITQQSSSLPAAAAAATTLSSVTDISTSSSSRQPAAAALSSSLTAPPSDLYASTVALPAPPAPTLQPPALNQFAFVNSPHNIVDDAAPIHGWRCHCWNSTNGSEVCSFVYLISLNTFFYIERTYML